MPHVVIQTADGYNFTIQTRQTETLLRAWFDEVLPHAFVTGRPGIDDFDVIWPKIYVMPMWAWKTGVPSDPDWLCDSRVLGRGHELPAKDGDTALKELLRIRQELERELAEMRR